MCSTQRELFDRTQEVLRAIAELVNLQTRALQTPDRDYAEFRRLDKELENQVGEKERAFGALRQHTAEHGCLVRRESNREV